MNKQKFWGIYVLPFSMNVQTMQNYLEKKVYQKFSRLVRESDIDIGWIWCNFSIGFFCTLDNLLSSRYRGEDGEPIYTYDARSNPDSSSRWYNCANFQAYIPYKPDLTVPSPEYNPILKYSQPGTLERGGSKRVWIQGSPCYSCCSRSASASA